MILIQGNVKIELLYQGEGWNGDYDVDDPEDVPLLRFDVYLMDEQGEWMTLDNASYCTQLTDFLSDAKKWQALQYLMRELHEPASAGYSLKRLCERLSWLKESDLNAEEEGLAHDTVL